jgi:endoglucanase
LIVGNSTGNSTSVKCPSKSTFAPISAGKFFDAINPGWNLGNTLDATETEGSWNNPPVVGSTFDDVKKAGYKGVRLPITYTFHMTSQSPDWKIDAMWLQRVEDVVDMVLSRGLYAIVNVHHDSTSWADLTKADTNVTMVEERMYRLWYQIGTKLACKGSMLAMEPINEIPGTTAEHGAEVNRLNTAFLQAINDAGGFNPQRVVTLVGAGEDGVKTTQWLNDPMQSSRTLGVFSTITTRHVSYSAVSMNKHILIFCRRLYLQRLGQNNLGLRRRQSLPRSRSSRRTWQLH